MINNNAGLVDCEAALPCWSASSLLQPRLTKAHSNSGMRTTNTSAQEVNFGYYFIFLFFFVHMFRLDLDPIKCIFILCQSLASLLVLVTLGYVFWVGHNSVVALVADVNILEVGFRFQKPSFGLIFF